MKKIILSVLVFFVTVLASTAQGNKPVQFNFKQGKDANGSFVSISTKLPKGLSLFSIKKSNGNDFASNITFDSSIKKFLKGGILESGNIKNVPIGKNGFTPLLADSVEWKQYFAIINDESVLIKATINWLGYQSNTNEFPNGEETLAIELKKEKATIVKPSNELNSKSLWSVFWLCFGVGIAAIFSPCVFPLIPITVSFFLKHSKTKAKGVTNSLWYSMSIILIYVIPTLLLTRIFGEKIMYEISTHPVTNILFFHCSDG